MRAGNSGVEQVLIEQALKIDDDLINDFAMPATDGKVERRRLLRYANSG